MTYLAALSDLRSYRDRRPSRSRMGAGMTRHVLHVRKDTESGEWQAWCCCGWTSYTWRLKEAARTAAETHAASVNAAPRP